MKNKYLIILIFPLITFSCKNNKSASDDSVRRANEANQKILENRKAEKSASFAVKAADNGIMEVELGRMAQQKTADPDIKEFAQRMVDEHFKANEELKNITMKKNIALPVYMSQENQNKAKNLLARSGNDFDKSYVDLMVTGHRDDIEAFQNAIKEVEDPELNAWARNSLPMLTSHLDMAKRIQDKINKAIILK
jgi:putative membrane protein